MFFQTSLGLDNTRPFQSIVRPVQYFAWPTHILEMIVKIGNGVANAFWESKLSATSIKKPYVRSQSPSLV